MKKALLLTLLLPMFTFANKKVVKVTPQAEVGSFLIFPKLTASVDAKVNVGKINKTNFEVGGGVSQGFIIFPTSALSGGLIDKDMIFGDTQVYALAEVNRNFTKDFTLYGQIKLGAGVGYLVSPREIKILGEHSMPLFGSEQTVGPSLQASLEGGIVYKKFNVGLNVGLPKVIALKLGYEIPVKVK